MWEFGDELSSEINLEKALPQPKFFQGNDNKENES